MELNKWLLNGVTIQLRLWSLKDKFVLIKETKTEGNFHLDILDVYLEVCRICPEPEIVMAHEEVLKKQPSIYPYNRHRIQTYSLAKGSYQYREDCFNTNNPNVSLQDLC